MYFLSLCATQARPRRPRPLDHLLVDGEHPTRDDRAVEMPDALATVGASPAPYDLLEPVGKRLRLRLDDEAAVGSRQDLRHVTDIRRDDRQVACHRLLDDVRRSLLERRKDE